MDYTISVNSSHGEELDATQREVFEHVHLMALKRLEESTGLGIVRHPVVDTSKSLVPGTQWGINAARRNGPSAALTHEVRQLVEAHLNALCQALETEYGIDVTLIPRPSWETTGLVGSAEDIAAVVAELEAEDGSKAEPDDGSDNGTVHWNPHA